MFFEQTMFEHKPSSYQEMPISLSHTHTHTISYMVVELMVVAALEIVGWTPSQVASEFGVHVQLHIG